MIEVTPLWMLAVILFLTIFPVGMVWLIRCAREEENPERNYSALLYAGNRAQLEKLNQNGHKGGWDEPIESLFKKLRTETYELAHEIHLVGPEYRDPGAIRHEAADVANYAHMIIQKCDRELEAQNGT